MLKDLNQYVSEVAAEARDQALAIGGAFINACGPIQDMDIADKHGHITDGTYLT
jgi:hypothetical protein